MLTRLSARTHPSHPSAPAAQQSAQLSDVVLNRFLALPQGSRIQAEYVWVGGSGQDLRAKTRTLEAKPTSVADLPEWNFDGSSIL